MRAHIGSSLLSSDLAQPRRRPFEIGDTRLAGFTLRVQPSGVRSYYARFGRTRRIALGKVGSINSDEAREQCQPILGNLASGRHPLEGLAGAAGMTFGQFLAHIFEPWARTNRPRTARNTLEKVGSLFKPWMAEPLSSITVERLELWKGRRLNSGIKSTTVLRELFALSMACPNTSRLWLDGSGHLWRHIGLGKPSTHQNPKGCNPWTSPDCDTRTSLRFRPRAMHPRRGSTAERAESTREAGWPRCTYVLGAVS